MNTKTIELDPSKKDYKFKDKKIEDLYEKAHNPKQVFWVISKFDNKKNKIKKYCETKEEFNNMVENILKKKNFIKNTNQDSTRQQI